MVGSHTGYGLEYARNQNREEVMNVTK